VVCAVTSARYGTPYGCVSIVFFVVVCVVRCRVNPRGVEALGVVEET
jgi:hypothetical protein